MIWLMRIYTRRSIIYILQTPSKKIIVVFHVELRTISITKSILNAKNACGQMSPAYPTHGSNLLAATGKQGARVAARVPVLVPIPSFFFLI